MGMMVLMMRRCCCSIETWLKRQGRRAHSFCTFCSQSYIFDLDHLDHRGHSGTYYHDGQLAKGNEAVEVGQLAARLTTNAVHLGPI